MYVLDLGAEEGHTRHLEKKMLTKNRKDNNQEKEGRGMSLHQALLSDCYPGSCEEIKK